MSRWDVIVVGAGAVGSATLRSLAESGARALCLEQYTPANTRGASHGHSRIFRHAYFEHPEYVPLLVHATARFESLERESGTSLLNRCGMLVVGPPDSEVVLGARASAGRWNLAVDSLEARGLRQRFPWFAVADDAIGAFESNAGIVRPEAAVHAQLRLAHARGAELRPGVQVLGITEGESEVTVETDHGTERAAAVVVAAGPWAARLLPELAPLITVTRQVQAWFAPRAGTDATDMPCWLLDRGAGLRALYGLAPDRGAPARRDGSPSPSRLPKTAFHGSDVVVDAARGAHAVEPGDIDAIAEAYGRWAPSLAGECVESATCLYTMSPDGNFLVGTRRSGTRVHFAAGLSGHGFKLAPALGDALAELALQGRTQWPIGFLAPERFAA